MTINLVLPEDLTLTVNVSESTAMLAAEFLNRTMADSLANAVTEAVEPLLAALKQELIQKMANQEKALQDAVADLGAKQDLMLGRINTKLEELKADNPNLDDEISGIQAIAQKAHEFLAAAPEVPTVAPASPIPVVTDDAAIA